MWKKLKYLVNCILHMDYKSLFGTVKTVHGITGKNSVYLFFDVVMCGLKYGAGHRDYLLMEFYLLTKAQRETYVTRGINNYITRTMNNRDFYYIFDNKDITYAKYAKYIARDWMFLPKHTKEEFVEFMKNRDVVIIKPSNQQCGVGVEKIKKSDYKSIDEMYEYITKTPSMIVEDVISQHEDINKVNPTSVNTLRIVTVISDGVCNVVYAFIRIGNGLRPVDNINAGGMCAPINLETGIIENVGYDKDRVIHECHPVTGVKIQGVKIPMWDKAIALVQEAGLITPEMGYVGWDVAMTENGPVLVEINNLPGHDFLQLPPHVPNRIGMLPQFKKYVKGL